MHRQLNEYRLKKEPVALFCVAVDNMEQIRSFHGKAAHDQLLAEISKVLQSSFRSADIIGRYEEHGFLILVGCKSDQAERIAQRVCGMIQKKVCMFEEKRLRTTTTVGIAVHPEHGRNLHELYVKAQKVVDHCQDNDIRGYAYYDEVCIVSSSAQAIDEGSKEIEVEMKLGVNIDHVATLRQARGTIYPDPLDAAIIAARAGAHGITAHLREDRRHIQDDDIYRLKTLQPLPLNLEMANVPEIVDFALEINPDEVCLVPEKRQELTTEGGLDVVGQYEQLCPTVDRFLCAGIEVSLFVDPDGHFGGVPADGDFGG